MDDGGTWDPVYTHNRSELGTGAVSLATEPLFARSVNLASYGGQTIRLRLHYSLGAENRAGSTPFGWYVDDIAIVNEFWLDVSGHCRDVVPGSQTQWKLLLSSPQHLHDKLRDYYRPL